MYRKYKIKKRKKVSLFLICSIIMVSSLFMSSGYALFSDTLKVGGTANIKVAEVVQGKSTYSWSIGNKWGNGTENDPVFYQILFPITNHDGDMTEWTLSFDVPDGVVAEKINSWSASSTSISGHTITMVCQAWNGTVADGADIAPVVEFQIAFVSTEPLTITNAKLNGKLMIYKEPEQVTLK